MTLRRRFRMVIARAALGTFARGVLCATVVGTFALVAPAAAQDAPGRIEGLPMQAQQVQPGAVVHFPARVPSGDSTLLAVPLPSATGSLHFMIDPASVSRPETPLVRYTLIARSDSGFRNVSYEGLNCANDTWHIYATWRADARSWEANADDTWLAVSMASNSDVHGVLDRDYWCNGAMAAGDAADLVRRLRRGLHPGYVSP